MSATFALLVPVKAWDRAKSRLVSTGAPGAAGLAEAFALDAIAAAARCPAVTAVYVVTDQPGFRPTGTVILPDEGGGDLNAALRAAETRVRAHHPGSGVAAICADLPCLRGDDLAVALDAARAGRWFVADHDGTGTTLLAAAPGEELGPCFGPGSARRHTESGAAAVSAPVVSLRFDVDTAADLERAVEIGVGAHTRAVLDRP